MIGHPLPYPGPSALDAPLMTNPNFPDNLDIQPSVSTHISGHCYSVESQQESIDRYGIAGRVWEAAYALKLYVDPTVHHLDPPFLSGDPPYTMIELGSGSGLVGSHIASRLQHRRDLLILTDLEDVCPLLEDNLRHIKQDEFLLIRPLPWGSRPHTQAIYQELARSERHLTHIICSDLIYFPHLLSPLLRTLLALTSPPFAPDPSLIISYKIRSLSKETPFWSAFGLWFTFHPVLLNRVERFGADMEGPTFIFIAHRRPESLKWPIPPDDRDLLDGVGAGGTRARKYDDSFESLLLLFMTVE